MRPRLVEDEVPRGETLLEGGHEGRRAVVEERRDVSVLDVVPPRPLKGFNELGRSLLLVVRVSAHVSDEDVAAWLRRGAVGSLAEPFSLNRLGRVLPLSEVVLDLGRALRAASLFS